MKNKLVIVADLGLLKAYRIDITPQGTPRLEALHELVLEEAHSRFSDRVTDLGGRHGAPAQRSGCARCPMITIPSWNLNAGLSED
jgi:hypothetical protein